jgi:hypothetical protein
MSRDQANALRILALEAYQPKLFAENQAARRIEVLRQEMELANSF